ncbi:AP-1 complex subunit mu-1-like isoform X2 [Zophobas morio]|uniref:AP-1 complex subunit mu-1-like isoform X2 n=1 Tax=Zophobas morio TaxID=2755281 RepID=UPI003082E9CA
MPFSALYVLDLKGKTLISREYRGDVPFDCIEKFPTLLVQKDEDGLGEVPIIVDGDVTYLFIKYKNVYLVATTRRNANVALIFVFLHKLVKVFKEYFKELEEESIRDNFVIIYELFDEIVDFGYIQTTETKILQEYITQKSHKLLVETKLPMAVTNAVSWRSDGIFYKKNEVFLDVIESVNLLTNQTGQVLQCEVVGAVNMRVYLSGMPELRLGLNDKILFDSSSRASRGKAVELEDIKFHQCVRLSRFENDRTISFIPPDGQFTLMSYRLSSQLKPLFWVESIVERHAHSRVEYMVKARSQFKRKSCAHNVRIHVPVPSDADSPRYKSSIGSVKYAPELNALVWSIRQFSGGKECFLRAHFGLPSVEKDEEEGKAPITVSFEIPYLTTSGIQVRYLKVIEKSGYQALPWVRYVTRNGG